MNVKQSRILLLTGVPGIGKTTLLRKVARALLPHQQDRIGGGFYTQEIRQHGGGQRQGFRLVAFRDEQEQQQQQQDGGVVIAHVDFDDRHRYPHSVGRYGVDVEAISRLADATLAPHDSKNHGTNQRNVYLVDEIGKMECLSPQFCHRMEALLNAAAASNDQPALVVATVGKKGAGLIDRVKHWPGSILLEIDRDNRDALATQAIAWVEERL